MNDKLKGGLFSDEWKARRFNYRFRRKPVADQPYQYQEYPKVVEIDGRSHTVTCAEHEEALRAPIPEITPEHE